MVMYLRHFKVRGRGEFPLDMLRYDQCWPRTGFDAEIIAPRYEMSPREGLGTREVSLAKHTSLKHGNVATMGRWASFGWTVVKEE